MHWFLLAAFIFASFAFQLGTRGLNEPDEGRYANIALEALEPDHPWWEPQLADVGHYDKPPLIYWVTALGYKIFGVNEWGARMPSLLGACFAVAGVGWMAWRLYGPRLAWLAVLIAGTLLQIWVWARILTPDTLLMGWCTLAIAAWAETRHRGGRPGWWLVQVVFWALAGWTKATPALLPMLGLAIYVYGFGGSEDRRALKLPLLLPLVILLSVPWYVVLLQWHPELEGYFWHRETVARITGHINGRAGPLYYYIPQCLLGWLPWWPLGAFAAWRQRARFEFRSGHGKSLFSPGACILLTGFCIFSLIGSKHATYLLPFAPWAALEMARLLAADAVLGRPRVIFATAGIATLLYTAGVSLVPARESKWGTHSSLRDVTVFLHQHGARGIYSDHFWPSLEVYWGEKIYFTNPAPEEIYDKSDSLSEHFGYANPVARKSDWFVHFRTENDSPFNLWLKDPRIPKTYIGDFVVGPTMVDEIPPARISASHARPPLVAAVVRPKT